MEAPDRHANNFTALRWIAAISVMLSHAYLLQTGTGLFQGMLGFDLGRCAVLMFFAISGYLIAGSAGRRSTGEFWAARLFRIFPGLIVCTLLTAILLASVSSLSPLDYFRSPLVFKYMFGSGTLLSTEYKLPGVFDQNPVTIANGSLWTLRYEIACYLLLFCLVFPINRLRLPSARIVAWLLLLLPATYFAIVTSGLPVPQSVLTLCELLFPFLIGSWFKLAKNRPSGLSALLVTAALALAMWFSVLRPFSAGLIIAVSTMYLAFAKSVILGMLNRLPDYSFGIYIYAYPLQQIVRLELGDTIGPLAQFALAVVLVMIPAALSWHLIEKPSLAMKNVWKTRMDYIRQAR